MKIKQRLRSDGAVLLALTLALLAQIPHAASVFYRLAPGGRLDIAQAIVYAVALEIAVLLFVMRGRRVVSGLFALGSIAVNLLYYFPEFGIAAAVLISAALPLAIALYSHEAAEDSSDEATQEYEVLRQEFDVLGEESAKTIARLESRAASLEQELAARAKELSALQRELVEPEPEPTYSCPYCGRDDFTSPQALGGHKGSCSRKPELVAANGHH